MPLSYRIAAIDIGSNAIRAVFAYHVDGKVFFFKNYRYPVRLGTDVFKNGQVSIKKIKEIENAFGELFLKVSKHKITKVRAVATSALRDAKNSNEILQKIFSQTGIEIEIIDGKEEALLIKKAVTNMHDIDEMNALLIDIGGGSTEVSLISQRKIHFTKSYQCGTVRLLQNKKNMNSAIEKFISDLSHDIEGHLSRSPFKICFGTGGNLRRMGKLRKLLLKRPATRIKKYELEVIKKIIEKKSLDERVRLFEMSKDRSDVIVPAMNIIYSILKKYKQNEIFLPKVGLKEGIVFSLLNFSPKEVHFTTKFQ